MKRISTHVLDIALGQPARDVGVRLERWENTGNWVALGSARTDADGRCAQLLPSDDASIRRAITTSKRSTDCIPSWRSPFRCKKGSRSFTFRCC